MYLTDNQKTENRGQMAEACPPEAGQDTEACPHESGGTEDSLSGVAVAKSERQRTELQSGQLISGLEIGD